MENISTAALLLAGVSSENKSILRKAWDRCPDNMAIASAFQVACETGQTDMVIDMLKRGARIGKESTWAACRSGELDTIKVLIEGGANITKVEVGILQRYGHTTVIRHLAELQWPRSDPSAQPPDQS
jgi:tagatose-1,6-bisphosphate aldolase